jgi:hypothetical protein
MRIHRSFEQNKSLKHIKTLKLQLLFISALLIVSFTRGQENIDTLAIQKIKNEGLEHSQVEQIAFELIDKAGPRLTNSKGYARAADYAVAQLTAWGLEKAIKEPWGEFGKGWELEKSYIAMTKPYYMPLIAVPKAWSTGTEGPVHGKVQVVDIESEEDFEKHKGKLKGVIVALVPDQDIEPGFSPDANRFTKEELDKMQTPSEGNRRYSEEARAKWMKRRALNKKIADFFAEEEVALILKGTRGKHGTVFTSSPRGYLKDAALGVPELEMAPEHVMMIGRLLENEVEVEVEADIHTTFNNADLQGYNVLAEIPGSDKNLASEVVMLGGHLDSWHGATGATDNAAGCIVMMEAVRILMEIGLSPKRTIRIALWGGEEQGLHGSRNYVKNHLGDPETMVFTQEHEKISAYYNIDNGTGRIRGIYLQGNKEAEPIFKDWFSPFGDIMENTTLTINNTGGTDHLAFDAVGIPGFQFIQDPVEYRTRTHHTNMDTYERLVIDDLKQMAVIVASFVYNTAQREEHIPRKVLSVKE